MADVPEHPLRVFEHVPHGKDPQDPQSDTCRCVHVEVRDVGKRNLDALNDLHELVGEREFGQARLLILSKIDLLRSGDVPLRGGVFGV